MNRVRTFTAILAVLFCAMSQVPSFAEDSVNVGPFFSRHSLTLEPGTRTEAAGPFYYFQESETERTIAFPPLYSHYEYGAVDAEEYDFIYPLLTYDRYGTEYRWQLFQLFSFAGSHKIEQDVMARRFTIFPIYFQQRSPDPELNYTALVPFYGHLKNRLFRDSIYFVMFPIFSETRKRDVVTDNYLFPFFHIRRGNELRGWQFWPLYGQEHKGITTKTNGWGDVETIPGHEKHFVLWPIGLSQTIGIGTTNREKDFAILPLYSSQRSTNRDSTTVIWPFFTWTEDRVKKYNEWDGPWPLVTFARGEGKTTSRVFPIYSHAQSATLRSDAFLWPIYKYNRIQSAPLDRERTRILLFLYSVVNEKNTETGKAKGRTDFWPFFHHRRDFNGNTYLQILAPLEPFLPNNKSIERDYSPVWSVWRSEKNPSTGKTSQSFLWNFYRRETAPDSKKFSLLFGLIQYHSEHETKHWRLFHIPLSRQKNSDHVSKHR